MFLTRWRADPSADARWWRGPDRRLFLGESVALFGL
jgi:hypothetical protein